MPPHRRRSSTVSMTSTHEPKSSRLSPGPTTPGSVPVVRSPLGMPTVPTNAKDVATARSRSHSTASTVGLHLRPTPPTSRRISRQPSTVSAVSRSSSRRMSGCSSSSSTQSPRDACEALLEVVAHRYAAKRQFAPLKAGIDLLEPEYSDYGSDSDSDYEDFDDDKILELAQRKATLISLVWANDFFMRLGRNIEAGSNILLQVRTQIKRCSKPSHFQAFTSKIEKMGRDLVFFEQASDYIAACLSQDNYIRAGKKNGRTSVTGSDISAIIGAIQRLQPFIQQLHEAAQNSSLRDIADIHFPFIQILYDQIQNDYILASWALNRYRKNRRSSVYDRTSRQGVQILYDRLVIRRDLYTVSLAYYGELLAPKSAKTT